MCLLFWECLPALELVGLMLEEMSNVYGLTLNRYSHCAMKIEEINLNEPFISTILFSKREIEEGPMSESPIFKTIQREGVPV
jgi:hypothetical protein